MKKGILALLAIATVAFLTACGAEESTLIVFQNKIEIDTQLRTYADAWAAENGYSVEVKSCGGDACAYGTQILAEFQTANQPDIFVIEGLGGFNQYKDRILPLDGEAWTDITDLALVVDGVTYGFPVAIEGWGMGYNADILDAAGVNPASLTTLAAYRTAFEQIEAAGFVPVSMAAAGAGMTWVTGLHNFNSYLSAQLDYTDDSVIRDLQAGVPNFARLNALADWVELLYEFSDRDVLLTGGYDQQVGLFARGEAAFIHQGNWIDGNLSEVTFPIGYAPHASMPGVNDSIFIGAPSFYVINSESPNIELAKEFLNDLAASPEGHNYMVNEANMVPAFSTVTLAPATPLSAAVLEYSQAGKAYAWWQNDMPPGFGMDTLGPIYALYARGEVDKAEFVDLLAEQIRGLA